MGTISPSEVAVSQQGGGWQRCLSLQLSRRCCSPSPCRRRRQARRPPFLPLAPLANCPSFLPKLAACSPAVRCLSLAPADEKICAHVPARRSGSQLLTEPNSVIFFAACENDLVAELVSRSLCSRRACTAASYPRCTPATAGIANQPWQVLRVNGGTCPQMNFAFKIIFKHPLTVCSRTETLEQPTC